MEQRWPSYDVPPASGADFERFVGTIFEDLGYQVLLTSPSHGFGADLILIEPGSGRQIAVETRFYSKGPLSNDAVQQVTSAVLAWGAAEGWVVTNAPGFSENAIHLAAANGVRLIDGNELAALAMQAEGAQVSNRIAAALAPYPQAAPAQAGMPRPTATSLPFDPLAPSAAGFDPLAPSTMVPPVDPYGAYAAAPGMDAASQAPYPYYPYPAQYPEVKKRHLGWLISILVTLAIIALLLAAYVFLAPPLFDAIEANNPGLHILRWDELIASIRPS